MTQEQAITGVCNNCAGRGRRGDGSACVACGGDGAITVMQGELFRKPPKFPNQHTEVDGITFDSQGEANRYGELVLLERAGEIRGLSVHRQWGLYCPGVDGVNKKVAFYESDFDYVYVATEQLVVEDFKGFRTALYALKKRWMKEQYGIEIQEIEA